MNLLGYLVERIFNGFPISVLEKFEDKIQRAQGKGTGSLSLKNEVKVFIKFLGNIKSDPKIIFDIGAHQGLWTHEIAEKVSNAEYYLFEPSSVNFSFLKDKFSEYKNIKVKNYALSDILGNATLFFDVPGSGLSSLVKRDLSHFDIPFENSESVQVCTLDSFVNENRVVPDAIKMDVEGLELSVLRGGNETLKNVSLIQFEFGGSNIDSRVFFRDIYTFFIANDYKLFRLAKNNVIPINKYKESLECFRVTVYFAFKKI